MPSLSSPYVMDGVRYARRVRRIKWALFLLVGIGTLGLCFYVFFTSGSDEAAISAKPPAPRLLAPHFRGVDDMGRPFDLRADKALWKNDSEVALEAPNAEAAYGDKGSLRVRAENGMYHIKDKTLFLDGDVKAFAESQEPGLPEFIEIRARGVAADLSGMYAHSNESVEATSDAFTLTAGAFAADGKKNIAYFTEGVRLLLRPKAFRKRHINLNAPPDKRP